MNPKTIAAKTEEILDNDYNVAQNQLLEQQLIEPKIKIDTQSADGIDTPTPNTPTRRACLLAIYLSVSLSLRRLPRITNSSLVYFSIICSRIT